MYITSMEIVAYKYIANFHSSEAADQFETYIKSLIGVNDQVIGIKSRYRNSIIFVCHDRDTGHQLGKTFENDYINRIAQQETPPQQPTQPEEIHVVEETTPEAPAEEVVAEEETTQEAPEAPNTEVSDTIEETTPEEPQTAENTQTANPLNKIFNVFKGNNN
jgi:ABC-type proline/glycine betaine transport system ATPase subunit